MVRELIFGFGKWGDIDILVIDRLFVVNFWLFIIVGVSSMIVMNLIWVIKI